MGLWDQITRNAGKAAETATAGAMTASDRTNLLAIVRTKEAAVTRVAGEARETANRLQQLVDTGAMEQAARFQGMYARHERTLYDLVQEHDTALVTYAERTGDAITDDVLTAIAGTRKEAASPPPLDVTKPIVDTALMQRLTQITGMPTSRPGVREAAQSYVLSQMSAAVESAGTGATIASTVRGPGAGQAEHLATAIAREAGSAPISVPAAKPSTIAAEVPVEVGGGSPIDLSPTASSVVADVPMPTPRAPLGRPTPQATPQTGIGRLNPLEFAKEPSLKEKFAMEGGGDINEHLAARLREAERKQANGEAPTIKLADIVDDGQSGWF